MHDFAATTAIAPSGSVQHHYGLGDVLYCSLAVILHFTATLEFSLPSQLLSQGCQRRFLTFPAAHALAIGAIDKAVPVRMPLPIISQRISFPVKNMDLTAPVSPSSMAHREPKLIGADGLFVGRWRARAAFAPRRRHTHLQRGYRVSRLAIAQQSSRHLVPPVVAVPRARLLGLALV